MNPWLALGIIIVVALGVGIALGYFLGWFAFLVLLPFVGFALYDRIKTAHTKRAAEAA